MNCRRVLLEPKGVGLLPHVVVGGYSHPTEVASDRAPRAALMEFVWLVWRRLVCLTAEAHGLHLCQRHRFGRVNSLSGPKFLNFFGKY